mgnify:CR=1 FL=1
MKDNVQHADLSALKEKLPLWVPRNWEAWSKEIPFIRPRTIANEDCRGTGVKVRILIGNVVAYERNSLIEYLESKSRILDSGGHHE